MSLALTHLLHKAVRECPEGPALQAGEQRHSFAELRDQAARLAAVLHALGVGPGDRVGMLAPNGLAYATFIWGSWWAGAALNPVNTRWSASEIAYSLDDCDTRVLIVDEPFVATAEAVRQQSSALRHLIYCGAGPAPSGWLHWAEALAEHGPVDDAGRGGEDLAMVMYTGGTTGRSKGVMLSHSNLYIATLASMAMAPRPTGGVALMAAPLFHIAGFATSVRMLRQQTLQVFLNAFEEASVLRAIVQHGVTEMFMVPTMIKRLIDHPDFAQTDTRSVRNISYGAAAIDQALLNRAMAALPDTQFNQAYGMTELSPTITMLLPHDHLPGPKQAQRLRSAGRPMPIAEVRIVDEHDQELPTGQVGEICARGPMVMQGYWNLPSTTAEALRGGWMHTGDAGFIDEDGYVHVVDRIKDMVISGGENVYCVEVESAITHMPQVAQCAVIGLPDEQWGERVHAVVVLHAGQTLSLADITTHCRPLIASYKIPRSLEIVDALPLSAAGKVLKHVLRAAHAPKPATS